MPHNFAHIGEELRNRRNRRGVSLAQMSEMTRIPETYLRAIEQLDKTALPNMSYALGYVGSYAKELGLPGRFAVDRFKTDLEISEVAVRRAPKQSIQRRPMRLPKGIFSGLAVSVFAASMAVWFGVQADDVVDPAQSLSAETYEVRAKAILPDDRYRIRAMGPSLVEIRGYDGNILIRRIFTPGQTWEGAAQAGLSISARNGSVLTLERGTQTFGELTQFGAALPEMQISLLEARLSGNETLEQQEAAQQEAAQQAGDEAELSPTLNARPAALNLDKSAADTAH